MNTESDELFSKAYSAYLEEKHDETVTYCREYLSRYPDSPLSNTIRVVLGSVLDSEDKSAVNIAESKVLFIEALSRASSLHEMMEVDGSADADPILHLGIWEMRRENYGSAALYLLIDYLLSPVASNSQELLVSCLGMISPETAAFMKTLIERVQSDHKLVPRIE
jgi:hypothetical protein